MSDRAPDPLVPVWAARLVGFGALASLGALQWQRMVAGLSSGRALLWVAAAVAAGAAVMACDRLPWRWRGLGTLGVAVVALIAALAVSGIELWLLKPAHWDELVDGLITASQALGTVRLPYDGADPWPGLTLQVAGSVLLTGAALLACWPRVGGRASRGYLFLALMALLVAVISPVVSLGGARPLLLGATIAALTVGFLWLERLPLRPGLGVAFLLGVALAGALPLASVADRAEPWFDYKAFAEGLGPDDPIRFSWDQRYGPIDWPRDGNEVMRVKSDEPHYWKAANLERFDGIGFADAGRVERDGDDFTSELREDWRNQPGWLDTVEVSVRRMRTLDVIAPGAVMDVTDATRPVQPSGQPGRWTARSELRRGDSYTAEVYVPSPTGAEVRNADRTGFRLARPENLEMTLALRPGTRPTFRQVGGVGRGRIDTAVVHFRPFGDDRAPYVTYPQVHRTGFGVADRTFRSSQYRRTWALAQRLRRQSETPFDYILQVNAYLETGFSYSERPPPIDAGRAPLDAFLFDTKEGYCQHFAGAMAMLLRMGGVPARVATGFSPGGFSKRRDAWIVRDTDAHAWVEAWFDELGWVTYDPTPDLTPARSQIAAIEEPAPATPAAADPATLAGGGGQAARRLGGVRPDLLLDPQRNNRVDGPGLDEGGGLPWWAFVLAGLAIAALVLWIAARVRRRRATGPLSPLDRAVAELEEALRRAGRAVPPGTTLRQLEHRLGASEEATAYLRALSASRYGATPRLPTVEERRALRRALAQGLGFAGRVRALWALPPRRGEHSAVEVELRVRDSG